jgi:hypothetical protein
MDTREAQSRSLWNAAFSYVCLLASDARARNTAFTSPLRFATWLAQTGEKGGKTEKKRWEKDNHLFPAGKIAMTLFSFFALKFPRELSLPFHMS